MYCELNDRFELIEKPMPASVRDIVNRIGENCEPSLCTVLFQAGAGGSLRAGVTQNPINITHSVAEKSTQVTMGGAEVYVFPGGGITVMVDVMKMPDNAFGYVPTPALVAPIEFSLDADLYSRSGGHMDNVMSLQEALEQHHAQDYVEDD